MKRITFLPSLAFLLLNTASADQLVLKNGDRVTGAIVKKDGKKSQNSKNS